ncbi:hypothetical protein J4459_01540 [Candidatus Woesearchaeota archaeon]|nr:hypothetical protein [Candidatus Woesearchaeota archaeon]
MVSTVSAGLLDEAKKSQERRKLELNNYQSASSFSSGTNSIFYNPYIPKEKGYSTDNELPFIKKEKVEKTDGKNVMKPGEKLNLGNHILIISKTLSFETKITDQGKEMDFGYFKLITQGEIPFEEDQTKLPRGDSEKKGDFTSPTGAPIKEIKKRPTLKDTSPTKGDFTSPTGAPIKEIKKRPTLKDTSPTKGITSPTGAVVTPVRKYSSNTKRFKVTNQNKQVKKGFLEKLRGKSITSPTGAITRESKEKPKILEKLKALFKR